MLRTLTKQKDGMMLAEERLTGGGVSNALRAEPCFGRMANLLGQIRLTCGVHSGKCYRISTTRSLLRPFTFRSDMLSTSVNVETRRPVLHISRSVGFVRRESSHPVLRNSRACWPAAPSRKQTVITPYRWAKHSVRRCNAICRSRIDVCNEKRCS